MRILVIPDTQAKPDVPLFHLGLIGQFIQDKQPDVVVLLGDHYDLPSLSSYDKGKAAAEGKRLGADLAAGDLGLRLLTDPINYGPELHVCLGNHENRLARHAENAPELMDVLTPEKCFHFKDYGFQIHPFLEPFELEQIQFCHYFCRGPNGQVMQSRYGMPNALTQVRREMKSSIAGHRQGIDFAVHQTHHQRFYGLIAGSCYLHEEHYLGPQGTKYWRGIVMLNRAKEGHFDPAFIGLDYLCERYAGRDLKEFLATGKDSDLCVFRG